MHRFAITAVAVCAAGAAGQPYSMDASTIDGGGGSLVGSTYTLSGTIGQHDAGVLEGSTYRLTGGFWGSTGSIGCNLADIAMPFGVLDLADIGQFVGGFTGGQSVADLDNNGIFDLADIGLFVSAFTGGCP